MDNKIDISVLSAKQLSEIDLDAVDPDCPVPVREPQRQYYFMAECRRRVKAFEQEHGRRPAACIQTFGCQMNARDSEKLAGILRMIGFEKSDTEEADFVLYNTCTVRDNADQKVYGRLGRLQALKKKNPDMMIALCGCMMQERSAAERIKKSYRFVDIIFGTHNIYQLAELLCLRMREKKGILTVLRDCGGDIVEELPTERKYPFKSGVNIMFGCDNFCSYCIVPYVRGRERSREPEDIIQEIRRLVSDGVKEVMLLGQNVNSYGKNLADPMSFAELLRQVNDIDGLERIRFMTSHPKDLSEDLIAAMRDCKKVCRHLHLPLQSGSSRILKMMNRRYTREQYLELTDRLRAAIPDISLTTDIIAGFPGETEEDFQDTLDMVRRVRFDGAFTFIYSKRTGTPAAAMEPQIPAEIVKERFDRLLTEVQQGCARNSERFLGSVQEVLVEETDSQRPGYLTGRMSSNLLVHFPGDKSLVGDMISVRLTETKGFYYLGIPAENMEDILL